MFNNRVTLATSILLSLATLGCGGGSKGPENKADSAVGGNKTVTVNRVPVVTITNFTSQEDIRLTSSITATDSDQDSLTFSLKQSAGHGTLTLESDGQFSYQPNVNFNGEDSFSIEVSDGKDKVSADIKLDITAVNDAPEVSDVATYTRSSQAISFRLPASDVDGDTLTFQLASQPKKGTAALNESELTYTPKESEQGVDSFAVSVSDGTATQNINLTVDNGLAFQGRINLTGADLSNAQVLLEAEGLLQRIEPEQNGQFKVYGLAAGKYSIKIRKPGYKISPSLPVELSAANQDETEVPVPKTLAFELEALDDSMFTYHWQEDQSTAGSDYSASINKPIEVEFLDEQVELVDDSSANRLQHEFNILLTDDGGQVTWTQEHAYRLLETMRSIPQQTRDYEEGQTLPASKWTLTSGAIEDDIQISVANGVKTVVISEAAFVNATPKLAKVEGKRGVYYSQKLHHALVRYVTNNGQDKDAYEKILQARYGVTTKVPNYTSLTASTTGSEPSSRFQDFHPEEIVQVINMFEEMPRGVHALPELKYLVRRLDGQTHPLYPEAPAVAWPIAQSGYIEFMESAFKTSGVEHMHRLIIHEKAHFLWQHQFDQKLKEDWIELGGWYLDADGNWATTKQTEFVSAYAHAMNPNEDMAESISYFVINPDKLRSRAPGKYEFVRDRIMQGNIYIAQIREDLTFEVYNLYPDYVFPGKIKRVDISVSGQPEQDKTVDIEIELHAFDQELEGAKRATMRIYSEIGTYVDHELQPLEGDLGTVLKGSFELSKHAKAGFWRTRQIVITDAVGNQRMEGANDFGWKLHVNNSLEDQIQPEYVANSLTLDKSVTQMEGQEVQVLRSAWRVDEAVAMKSDQACHATLNDKLPETYSFESYGQFNTGTNLCVVELIMPHYMPSATYSLSQLSMEDSALNKRAVYFGDPGHALRPEEIVVDEVSPELELKTNNPDNKRPELDLNDIQIVANPINPSAPNGETKVEITFKVRDNISGYRIANLTLRDPQGVNHNYWAYNDETYSIFPKGDTTEWKTYTRSIILPVGSAPGTWGLSEMTIYDRANNFKGYDFTEIVHFDVME